MVQNEFQSEIFTRVMSTGILGCLIKYIYIDGIYILNAFGYLRLKIGDSRLSGGTVARTVAHSSKLKSKLQIGAPGKKHRNLAKNARILFFFFFNSG